MSPDLRDPDDPIVKAAMSHKCECGAKPGEVCTPVTGKPFPDRRLIHFARIQRWDVTL